MESNVIEELIRALKDNTNLHTLSMTNVKFSEDHAIVSEERIRKRDGRGRGEKERLGGRGREQERGDERQRERERKRKTEKGRVYYTLFIFTGFC
jgi:hypothetical protein